MDDKKEEELKIINNDKPTNIITRVKYALLIFSLCFVALIFYKSPSVNIIQSGGGLEKISSLANKFKKSDMSAAGFAIVLKFLSGCIFLIGIVVILSVLPVIPIAILLLISYYLYREQIYALKTL